MKMFYALLFLFIPVIGMEQSNVVLHDALVNVAQHLNELGNILQREKKSKVVTPKPIEPKIDQEQVKKEVEVLKKRIEEIQEDSFDFMIGETDFIFTGLISELVLVEEKKRNPNVSALPAFKEFEGKLQRISANMQFILSSVKKFRSWGIDVRTIPYAGDVNLYNHIKSMGISIKDILFPSVKNILENGNILKKYQIDKMFNDYEQQIFKIIDEIFEELEKPAEEGKEGSCSIV